MTYTITATTNNGLIVSSTVTKDEMIKDYAVMKYTSDGHKVIIKIEE